MKHHPLFGSDYPTNEKGEFSVPDFAILQNSRTKETNLWTRERGQWFPAGEDEYDILNGIARLIRTTDQPIEVLNGLKFAAQEGKKELDNDEDFD